MNKLIALIASLSIAGFLVGTVNALSAGAQYTRREQQWTPSPNPNAFDEIVALDRADLLKTGHFGYETVQPVSTQIDDKEETKASFPLIVAVHTIGQKPFVTVLTEDRKVMSFEEGAVLEGGWTIESITLDRVIVAFEGTTTEISVFPQGSEQ